MIGLDTVPAMEVVGLDELAGKLHPSALRISPQMAAVLAHLFGESWTQPPLVWMRISDSGTVETDFGPIGTATELTANLLAVSRAADLSTVEQGRLFAAARTHVEGYDPDVPER